MALLFMETSKRKRNSTVWILFLMMVWYISYDIIRAIIWFRYIYDVSTTFLGEIMFVSSSDCVYIRHVHCSFHQDQGLLWLAIIWKSKYFFYHKIVWNHLRVDNISNDNCHQFVTKNFSLTLIFVIKISFSHWQLTH